MALATSLLGAITFTTAAGAKTVVATPTLGDMIVVIVAATGVGSGLGVTDNNTDGHGGGKSYTVISTALKAASADSMVAFVRADPIRQAVSTTWTTSGDGSSTGGGIYVMRVTGATLSGAAFIRQSGHQDNNAGSTPAIPLSFAALTTNALITILFDATSTPTIAVPAGWAVSDVNAGYTVPTTGIEGTHINSGFTGSTVTWGGASTAFGAIAFEMSAAQGSLAVSPEIPKQMQEQAVKRASVFCLGEKWARRGKLWIPAADRPYAFA